MTRKTLLWLVPLVLLLLLLLFVVPSALPYAGAEDLPVFTDTELANPHPDPIPMAERAPYAPHADGYLPDESGYLDGTISVQIEKRMVGSTQVYIASVQIADPSQLRTATARPYPSKAQNYAIHLAEREKAVLAINGDWFVDNGGYGIIYRNGKLLRNNQRYTTFDALIIDFQGDFHLIPSPSPEDFVPYEGRIMHSFCFGPALVIDGELQEMPDHNFGRGLAKKTQRQAFCQIGPLHYLIVTAEGPERNKESGLTIRELSQLCYDLGARQAFNMDGGASTHLVLNNQKLNYRTVFRQITDIVYFVTAEPES